MLAIFKLLFSPLGRELIGATASAVSEFQRTRDAAAAARKIQEESYIRLLEYGGLPPKDPR